MTDCNRKRSI